MLPTGKLPPGLLSRLIASSPTTDSRLILGPGEGLDCAVLDYGDTLLAVKTDPITFATHQIGWYLVQITTNDIVTTGALPRWLLVTMLLPENLTSPEMVAGITDQLSIACQAAGMVLVGGHTEITVGLDRPILVGTVIGEVARDKLVTPRGAQPGDRVLLTKGVPIEATAILASEMEGRLSPDLTTAELMEAKGFLFEPGISVMREARIAQETGRVTAMHDPTEGGLAGALWELSAACGHSVVVELAKVTIPSLSARICQLLEVNPLAAIASGALLFTSPQPDAQHIQAALENNGIRCGDIGWIEKGQAGVWQIDQGARSPLNRPARDEIARILAR